MALNRQGGSGILLPPNYQVSVPGAAGVPAYAGAGPLSLAAGSAFVIPAGQYVVHTGPYTFIQYLDPVLGCWRTMDETPGTPRYITSDGASWRVVNLSGCAVGAFITNVGSGYTSAPTVTASAGGSTWKAIVGGAVNSTVTVSAGGSGYTLPPIVLISAPPTGGVQATAVATISGGAVSAITVINQGAGYAAAPTITIIRDPRDTTGYGATATTTLTGAGTITAILCTSPGTAQTAVPTLTIAGGGGSSAAATAVMCFAATGFTVGTAGAVYGNAQPFAIITTGGLVGGSAGAVVNPSLDRYLFTPRSANIAGTSTAGGAIQTTGAVITDPGLFQAVPTGIVLAGNSVPTTQGQVTITVGGVSDTVLIQPI